MGRVLAFLPICLLLHDQQPRLGVIPLYRIPERLVAGVTDVPVCHAEETIRKDPLAFLRMSLDRCEREVHGYSCLLCKTERVNGTLKEAEEVTVHFKAKPHSVFMHWHKGAGKAVRVLYVQGENDDKLLAMPAGLLGVFGVQARSLKDPDSRGSGRYLISEFGIGQATKRTVDGWTKCRAAGILDVRFDGVYEVPQLNNRRCWKVIRKLDPPDEDGFAEGVFYFDMENWLQIGSILRDREGNLLAEYFFRDLVLNPTFAPDQFTPKAL